jgi:hypothetical protein
MMPVTATREPLDLPHVERAELTRRAGIVQVEQWEPERRVLRVELSAADKLLIRTFSFPGWIASVDGEPAGFAVGEGLRVELGNSEETLIRALTFTGGTPIVDGKPGRVVGSEPLGDIVIDLPLGVHRVTLDYVDTGPRRAGVMITVGASILISALVLMSLLLRLASPRQIRAS